MKSPPDTDIPFFAYGIFRPGQLGFHALREFVVARQDPVVAEAVLVVRDGLPLLVPQPGQAKAYRVSGALLWFGGNRTEAYRRIAEFEPSEQYRWDVLNIDTQKANCLLGRSPDRGSVPAEGQWDGRADPLFTIALEVVEETVDSGRQFDWDLKPLFRLEMGYLLLWTAIERYASLRYDLGRNNAVAKVMRIATDEAFVAALQKHVTREARLYSAGQPRQAFTLARDQPQQTLNYYYQMRSNLVHRGKGVGGDHARLLLALEELLAIFRDVLEAAFESAD